MSIFHPRASTAELRKESISRVVNFSGTVGLRRLEGLSMVNYFSRAVGFSIVVDFSRVVDLSRVTCFSRVVGLSRVTNFSRVVGFRMVADFSKAVDFRANVKELLTLSQVCSYIVAP